MPLVDVAFHILFDDVSLADIIVVLLELSVSLLMVQTEMWTDSKCISTD